MNVIRSNGEMVSARCARCREPFSQPWGAVTSAVCQPCKMIMALESEAAGDTPESVSALFRAVFEGIMPGETVPRWQQEQ